MSRARRPARRSAPDARPEGKPARKLEGKPAREPERKPERKSEATRRRLLDRALKLFQQRGVEATTMRSIARAAGLSLGAAYYYFPSKEALMFAFYDANQDEAEAEAERATGDLRARLGAAFHARLASVEPHRRMLAALISRLVDPHDPLSALSPQQRGVRERSIAVLAHILDGSGLSPAAIGFTASALWLAQMAVLLLYVHDDSPDQARTHRLVDDALDMLVPMLPVLDTPFGRAIVDRIVAALARAGIGLPAPVPEASP